MLGKLGVSLLIGILYMGKTYFNNQNKFTKFLAENTYLVYILHGGIVVIFQVVFEDLPIGPINKWLVVGLISLVLSYFLSYLIRKIPFFRKNY